MDTIGKSYTDDGLIHVMQESTNESILEHAAKELEKIPEVIRKNYGIGIDEGGLDIHHPSFLSIKINHKIEVIEKEVTFEINSASFMITIWKNSLITHTVIF